MNLAWTELLTLEDDRPSQNLMNEFEITTSCLASIFHEIDIRSKILDPVTGVGQSEEKQ